MSKLDYDEDEVQTWKFERNMIKLLNYSLCFDSPQGSTAQGTEIDAYPCHGGSNQQWEIIELGLGVNSQIYLEDQNDGGYDDQYNYYEEFNHQRNPKKNFKKAYIYFDRKLNLICMLLICILMFATWICVFKCLNKCLKKNNIKQIKGKSEKD